MGNTAWPSGPPNKLPRGRRDNTNPSRRTQQGGRSNHQGQRAEKKIRRCHHGRRIKTRDPSRQTKPARDPTDGRRANQKTRRAIQPPNSPRSTSKGARIKWAHKATASKVTKSISKGESKRVPTTHALQRVEASIMGNYFGGGVLRIGPSPPPQQLSPKGVEKPEYMKDARRRLWTKLERYIF
jgi:hypothetical protein